MKKTTILKQLLLGVALCLPFAAFASINPHSIAGTQGMNPNALREGLNAYQWAVRHGDVKNKNILTIIDYTKPSTAKRLYVINLKKRKVVMNILVSHGKGSGHLYARHFSDRFNTDDTSLGVFVTNNYYIGDHGRSMRIRGLEKGINTHALARNVVIHSAWYATPKFAKKYGYLGRSWGCIAVSPAVKNQFIDTLGIGSVIFSYAKSELRDANVNAGVI